MYNKEQDYLDMSDYALEELYMSYVREEKYHKYILKIDLKDDLKFMQKLIRKRKLNKIEIRFKFGPILDKIEKMSPPNELIELLVPCKTNENAIKVLNFIESCYKVDPNWEEDWLEKDIID